MTGAGVVCAAAVFLGVSVARGLTALLRVAVVLGRSASAPGRTSRLWLQAIPSGAAVLRYLPGAEARADRWYGRALPEALDVVTRSLRSGCSLRRALADAAELAPGDVGRDLGHVMAAADVGRPLAAALDDWAATRPRPDVRLVVAALALAVETGGASARAVDGVATTLRRRLAAHAEAHALGAQARASATVLVAAPLVFTAASLAGGGPAARFLLGSPIGLVCLVAGVALDAVGGWWMARLTGAVGR